MMELRNVEADLSRFRARVLVASITVVVCFSLVAARLAYLQIVRHEDLLEQAENNRTAIVPIVPNRGLILDRNGVVLATNFSAYTLEITPSKVASLEQTVADLSQVLDITPRDKRRFRKLMDESRSFESIAIRTKLTDEEFRNNLHNAINQFSRSGKADDKKWAEFSANIYYQRPIATRTQLRRP